MYKNQNQISRVILSQVFIRLTKFIENNPNIYERKLVLLIKCTMKCIFFISVIDVDILSYKIG